MSSQSERVNTLIQEHSSLNKPEVGYEGGTREQKARVTEIRQELVQIYQPKRAD
jgi:hypothetical protein